MPSVCACPCHSRFQRVTPGRHSVHGIGSSRDRIVPASGPGPAVQEPYDGQARAAPETMAPNRFGGELGTTRRVHAHRRQAWRHQELVAPDQKQHDVLHEATSLCEPTRRQPAGGAPVVPDARASSAAASSWATRGLFSWRMPPRAIRTNHPDGMTRSAAT